MNIFALDIDPFKSAMYMNDRHVLKMIVESAQMLSTISHSFGVHGPYRVTHPNHPCVAWAGATEGNWTWLYVHFIALLEEYAHRFNRTHACARHALALWEGGKPTEGPLRPFVQCVPEELRGEDAIASYRRYYIERKQHLAGWTNRPIPWWWEWREGAGNERAI